MAKKKSDVTSDADLTPTQEVVTEVPIIEEIPEATDTASFEAPVDETPQVTEDAVSEPPLKDTARVETPTAPEAPVKAEPITKQSESKTMSIAEITDMMNGTMEEIERCNEYIYAHADSDRRFTVYREELYTYRYKLRQLTIDPRWPNIPIRDIPTKPEVITDC